MKNVVELKGKYGKATIYAKTIEDDLIKQCVSLLNEPMTKDRKIAIMPDTHVGKGCMIGTTMEVKDEVCPNLVGVDIGCGMLTVNLGKAEIDLEKIDRIIDKYVPLGFNRHKDIPKEAEDFFNDPKHKIRSGHFKEDVALLSLGTLGGGNHFIEIDKDDETGEKYLIIHTGSRNLGIQVADFWQEVAVKNLIRPQMIDVPKMIDKLKAEGRHLEIKEQVQKAKQQNRETEKSFSKNKDLATLKGDDLNDYLHDMKVTTEYAKENRKMIANTILKHYYGKDLSEFEHFETVHNYIDTEEMILRKGAVSAKDGEMILIPLNMRDGSLIAIGKGNKDWNCSAPHGAGRLMSRSAAKEKISMDDFVKSMEGIYSTSVGESTIDESPFAYKDAEEIIELVKDTVDIIKHIKPIYNRKA